MQILVVDYESKAKTIDDCRQFLPASDLIATLRRHGSDNSVGLHVRSANWTAN